MFSKYFLKIELLKNLKDYANLPMIKNLTISGVLATIP